MIEDKNLNSLQDEELDQVNGGFRLNNDLVHRGEKPDLDGLVFDPEEMPDVTHLIVGGGNAKSKGKNKKTNKPTMI